MTIPLGGPSEPPRTVVVDPPRLDGFTLIRGTGLLHVLGHFTTWVRRHAEGVLVPTENVPVARAALEAAGYRVATVEPGTAFETSHDRHDRQVLDDIRRQHASADPAGSHRGYLAATAALNAAHLARHPLPEPAGE